MPKIRLRGVYSLALSGLLREHGWQIVQPAEDLQAYIQSTHPPEPFDLQIYDRDDLQGIIVTGPEADVSALQKLLSQALPNVAFSTPPVRLEAIYLGLVRRRRAAGYAIDLGGMDGFLPKSEAVSSLRPGEALRVQVCEIADAGEGVIVTTEISIAGRFAVLSSTKGVGISREINDLQERERLIQLGRRWLSHDWGIIWRTAAWGRDAQELQREIESLKQVWAQLDDHPCDGIPGLLCPGTPTLIVEFPEESQRALDLWKSRLAAPIIKEATTRRIRP